MAMDLYRASFEQLPQLRIARTAKRLRARRAGRTVVDTKAGILVWEPRRVVPQYAVPVADLDLDLQPTSAVPLPVDLPSLLPPGRFGWHTCPGTPMAATGDAPGRQLAFRPDDPDLDGYVILSFGEFDWIEEDQPVMSHPHDPFARIDVLRSDRHVRVELGGVVLADSMRPMALFETPLPVRYYLPRADVRMELLRPSPTHTICSYKGKAGYFTADLPGGDDIAWFYPDPLNDAVPVRNLLCFWSERTDMTVDGERFDAAMPPNLE